jgi:integrase
MATPMMMRLTRTLTPMAMTAHVLYPALDPDRCGTLSPIIIEDVIRTRIGFDGLLMTDDLDMKALGGAMAMKVEDVFTPNRRLWVRLHEKGGKEHTMPCHHNLEAYLVAYIDGCGLGLDPQGPLFRTIGRGTRQLTETPLPQANAWAMVQRRALAAGIVTQIGNHTFRATGITAYLKNGGTLERAATMANHASTRTTQLYDRRSDDITLDEVERVLI